MSASQAGSDYGSDFGDDVELELRDILQDIESQHSPHLPRPGRQDVVAANDPELVGMPTVLLDHDMDEYGWREGGIEVLEDDLETLIMPMEIDHAAGKVRC